MEIDKQACQSSQPKNIIAHHNSSFINPDFHQELVSEVLGEFLDPSVLGPLELPSLEASDCLQRSFDDNFYLSSFPDCFKGIPEICQDDLDILDLIDSTPDPQQCLTINKQFSLISDVLFCQTNALQPFQHVKITKVRASETPRDQADGSAVYQNQVDLSSKPCRAADSRSFIDGKSQSTSKRHDKQEIINSDTNKGQIESDLTTHELNGDILAKNISETEDPISNTPDNDKCTIEKGSIENKCLNDTVDNPKPRGGYHLRRRSKGKERLDPCLAESTSLRSTKGGRQTVNSQRGRGNCEVASTRRVTRSKSSRAGQRQGKKREAEENYSTIGSNKRSRRCKVCGPCTSTDCGDCVFCLDKPKFGGPNKKKGACLNRRCVSMISSTSNRIQESPGELQHEDVSIETTKNSCLHVKIPSPNTIFLKNIRVELVGHDNNNDPVVRDGNERRVDNDEDEVKQDAEEDLSCKEVLVSEEDLQRICDNLQCGNIDQAAHLVETIGAKHEN